MVTASMTVRHPVHRQRWAANARSMPTGVGSPLALSAAARTMIPGVQNPHCDPPVATKASVIRSRSAGWSPSTVVTSRPAIRATGVTQATRAAPSTSTVQQPHCPWGAQPSLTLMMPRCSRSTESRVSPGAASTSTCSPSHPNCTRPDIRTSCAGG